MGTWPGSDALTRRVKRIVDGLRKHFQAKLSKESSSSSSSPVVRIPREVRLRAPNYWRVLTPKAVTPEDIRTFLCFVLNHGLPPLTVFNRFASSSSSSLSWTGMEGVIIVLCSCRYDWRYVADQLRSSVTNVMMWEVSSVCLWCILWIIFNA